MNLLDELSAIESRAQAATAGPWQISAAGGPYVFGNDGAEIAKCDSWQRPETAHKLNATFIAAARTDLPKLCEALKVAIAALQDFGAQGALVRLETILAQPETKP